VACPQESEAAIERLLLTTPEILDALRDEGVDLTDTVGAPGAEMEDPMMSLADVQPTLLARPSPTPQPPTGISQPTAPPVVTQPQSMPNLAPFVLPHPPTVLSSMTPFSQPMPQPQPSTQPRMPMTMVVPQPFAPPPSTTQPPMPMARPAWCTVPGMVPHPMSQPGMAPPPGMVPQPTAPPGMVPQPTAPPGMAPQPMATLHAAPQPMAPPGMASQPMATPGMAPQPMMPPGVLLQPNYFAPDDEPTPFATTDAR